MIAGVLADAGRQLAEVTMIAVGVGPGPFTGLRVGLMTARTMGLALDVDVVGVCSLDAIAASVIRSRAVTPGAPFVVATDARRHEVYWAAYDAGTELGVVRPRRLTEPAVGPAERVDRRGRPVAGRGATLYPAQLGEALPPLDPPAAELARLAVAGAPYPLPPQPLYLRRPDAQESAARKRVLR